MSLSPQQGGERIPPVVAELPKNPADPSGNPPPPPVVAYFIPTYLRPEMRHIHRQIGGLKDFRPFVIAQKRENETAFPQPALQIIQRSSWRWIGRTMENRFNRGPWQIAPSETDRILDALLRENASLLHVFFGNVAIHLLPLFRKLPIPLVVSFHGADVAGSMRNSTTQPALREVFSRASRILCRSESLRQSVLSLECPENKTGLARTAVPDLPWSVRTPPEDNRWILVQACRLIPKKGLETTLRAFADFLREHPLAKLHLAGEGPLQSSLEQMALELGIADSVILPGFLQEDALFSLYQKAHVFLHPSEDAGDGNVEGIPNAMLEAMMTGLPILATRHGGIPEAITHNESGLLCDEGDWTTLAASLARIAKEPIFLSCLSKAARMRVENDFSVAAQSQKMSETYHGILAESRR